MFVGMLVSVRSGRLVVAYTVGRHSLQTLLCVGMLVSVRSGRLVAVYTAGSQSGQTVLCVGMLVSVRSGQFGCLCTLVSRHCSLHYHLSWRHQIGSVQVILDGR